MKAFSKITGLILGLIGFTALLGVVQTVIPDMSGTFYNTMTSFTNTTHLGSGAVTLAGNAPTWFGYLWVLVPILVAIGVISGLLYMNKGRRRGRYR